MYWKYNPNALLHEAAEHGKKELAVEILKVNRDSIDSTTLQGVSVLHSAIAGVSNKEIIEILLQAEPTLVTKKDASGLTPSRYNTSKEILEILQDYEWNVIDQILIKTPKYVPITPSKCSPIEVRPNWEKDFEEYLECKTVVGQTNPKINNDEF